MRRDSSTVLVLVGEVTNDLLTELARSMNISVALAPGTTAAGASQPPAARAGWEPGAQAMRAAAGRHSTYAIVPQDPLGAVAAAWRKMWDVTAGPGGAAEFEYSAAEALAAWRARQFELPDYYLVLAPVLPDSDSPDPQYLQTRQPEPGSHRGTDSRHGPHPRRSPNSPAPAPQPGPAPRTDPAMQPGPDLYLGPLRAARPNRVPVIAAGSESADAQAVAAMVTTILKSLRHGPWWPPLDEVLDVARHYFPGSLPEAQLAAGPKPP